MPTVERRRGIEVIAGRWAVASPLIVGSRHDNRSGARLPQPECQGQQSRNGCNGLAGHSAMTGYSIPGSKQGGALMAIACIMACMRQQCCAIAQPTYVHPSKLRTPAVLTLVQSMSFQAALRRRVCLHTAEIYIKSEVCPIRISLSGTNFHQLLPYVPVHSSYSLLASEPAYHETPVTAFLSLPYTITPLLVCFIIFYPLSLIY